MELQRYFPMAVQEVCLLVGDRNLRYAHWMTGLQNFPIADETYPAKAMPEEDRLREAADAAPVLIWNADTSKAFTWFNTSWLLFTGRTMDQELGHGWVKGVHPEDSEEYLAKFNHAFDRRASFRMEYRLMRHDGEYRILDDTGVPRFSEEGAYLGYTGSCIDVTEQRAAEVALRQHEEQLRLATDAAEVGLWDVDLATDTLYWPARVKAMFGISAHVHVTMADFYAGLHPDDKERVGAAFALALDAGTRAVYDVEYRTIGKEDGKIRWVAAKGRGIFDDKGACTRVIGTAIDITDRKRGEEAVQRLAAIVEWSDDAIMMKDLDGLIASWNRGAERIFGYTAAEMIGMPVTLLVPEELKNEELIIMARILEGETVDHYETVRRCKDGRLIDISLTISPVRGIDGKIIGASKLTRDISDEKRRREQRDLVLREMDHRIKNLFALASGVVALSARTAKTPKELAHTVGERLGALARANALTLRTSAGQTAMLHALIGVIVLPYDGVTDGGKPRVTVSGCDIEVTGEAVTNFALLLHEFATNAAKYGALSVASGYIDIVGVKAGGKFLVTWREQGGPPVNGEGINEGFGSQLARMTVQGQLGGEFVRDWGPNGLCIRVSVDHARLTGSKRLST